MLQTMAHFRADVLALRNLMNNLVALEESCSVLENDMVPLLTQTSRDATKVDVVQGVGRAAHERHAAFGLHRQKASSIVTSSVIAILISTHRSKH